MSSPLTVSFREVLHGVHMRLGGNPDDLQVPTAAAITEYVNSAYKMAWRHYEWPDVLEVEERTTSAEGLIGYQDSGETQIETPFLVTRFDPRTAKNPQEIGYRLGKAGLYLGPDWFEKDVWVTFRPPSPKFTSTEWSSTAYVVGSLVYSPTQGNVYRCIQAHTNQAVTNATYWVLVPFLDLLAEPVKAGAYAAMTREEGQAPIAELIFEEMQDHLLREIERLELQSDNGRTIRVRMDG